MSRNVTVKYPFLAAVLFATRLVCADVASPPSYHTMWYPTWVLEKFTGGHGHAVLFTMLLVAIIGVLACVCIRLRRQGRFEAAKILVRRTIMTSIVSALLVYLVAYLWQARQHVMAGLVGGEDVTVNPQKGEGYGEYCKRVRCLNGYCPNCGEKMFRSSDVFGPRRWICGKCRYGDFGVHEHAEKIREVNGAEIDAQKFTAD